MDRSSLRPDDSMSIKINEWNQPTDKLTVEFSCTPKPKIGPNQLFSNSSNIEKENEAHSYRRIYDKHNEAIKL